MSGGGGEAVWDDCKMDALMAVLPDVGDHVGPLAGWQVGDVRRRFGLSPLVICAMACLWRGVGDKLRKKVLRADYADIMRAVERCDDVFAQPVDWAPCVQ